MTDRLTDRELQSLRNMGNECERAEDEIERLRAEVARAVKADRERCAKIVRDAWEVHGCACADSQRLAELIEDL